MKKQKITKGDAVVYSVPGKPDRMGEATSGVDAYNRVGIYFHNGEWGYCWADYVELQPKAEK